jgi:ATP-dependent protease ClpP protease subunit
MSAQEAKEYGLVDQVLERIPPGHIAARAPSLG